MAMFERMVAHGCVDSWKYGDIENGSTCIEDGRLAECHRAGGWYTVAF